MSLELDFYEDDEGVSVDLVLSGFGPSLVQCINLESDSVDEKMKKDIEIIAGEYITLEGDGDYDKASQLIATKGIVSPILQKDLDRIAQAGIPKDIYFQQGLQTLGL